MKKLFTTLALAGAVVLGAHAQTEVDLGITNVFLPEDGASYENLAEGDTLYIAVEFKNFGTEAITASDTIYLQVGGIFLGSAGGNYNVTWNAGGFELGAGEVDTFVAYTLQGEYWGAGEGGEDVNTVIATDASQTFDLTLYSRYADGNLIIESDFTEGSEPDTWNLGENNGASVTATYGVLSISVADLTSNIQVYPNPAQNEINFAYNFEKPSGAKANIMDLSGRTVFTKDFGTQASGNQNFTIPVADLPNGNYTLEFVTEGSRGVSKFTVTK